MNTAYLGDSSISISKCCLGTMTFGEQVNKTTAFSILDCAFDHGINFLDTAEMYPIPSRLDTFGMTEVIIGQWFRENPTKHLKMQVATKIAGPARGLSWIRDGASQIKAQDFEIACDASLRRLQIDAIDLYQIHWPIRHVPAFG